MNAIRFSIFLAIRQHFSARRGDVQHLQHEQPQRHQRREQTLAPHMSAVAAGLIQWPGEGKIRKRLALQASKNVGDSHPWPPVKGVVRNTMFAGGRLSRQFAKARSGAEL
jgi:hypothetical protein